MKHIWRSLTLWLVVVLILIVGVGSYYWWINRPTSSIPGNSGQPGQRLIFNDEFNGSTLDTTKWNIGNWAPANGGHLAYLAPDDVTVQHSYLELSQEKRPYNGYQYTAGGVDTHGKFSYTYGTLMVRAKFSRGAGLHDTLWQVGTDCNGYDNGGCRGQWPGPGAGEIDMAEIVTKDPHKIYYSVHHGTSAQPLYNGCVKSDSTNYADGFHIYSMNWQHGEVRFYVDGVLKCDVVNSDVPDYPMYLILSTTVGGSFAGPVSPSTPFPQSEQVDYVRVYQ